jgi:hypothetical protein
VTRRISVILLILVVLFVGALAVRAAVHRLTAKDSSAQQRTLRTRADLIENDPFVNALLAAHHSTQSLQESLRCQPAQSARWNVRVAMTGGVDLDRLATVLAEPQAFGWTDAGPDVYVRAIEPGVVVKLVATVGPDEVALTTNLSTGLACPAA